MLSAFLAAYACSSALTSISSCSIVARVGGWNHPCFSSCFDEHRWKIPSGHDTRQVVRLSAWGPQPSGLRLRVLTFLSPLISRSGFSMHNPLWRYYGRGDLHFITFRFYRRRHCLGRPPLLKS